MATTKKSLSLLQVARRYTVRPQTDRMFIHKVREAMKYSESQLLTGSIHVDEFVIGRKETGHIGRYDKGKKKKVVCALELTDSGKVKRFYAIQIQDFSSKSLRPIFEKHIDKEAQVSSDEWKGHRPIGKDYPITQIPSDLGLNFAALHNMIHQVKSRIQTTYSWVSKKHINRYLNEYSYRINRSQAKETIFHNLITRIVKADKTHISLIICS